mgnify:CR=1 FL=1
MSSIRILLVDDEADFVQTLAERLELRGFDIRIANDGDGAFSHMESRLPDLVVLDVMMPGIGGLDVLQQIRRSFPEVQVILLTGRGSTHDGIKGMRLGAFDYLMKPCDMDQLIGKVNEATRKKQGHEEKIREAHVKEILSKRGY